MKKLLSFITLLFLLSDAVGQTKSQIEVPLNQTTLKSAALGQSIACMSLLTNIAVQSATNPPEVRNRIVRLQKWAALNPSLSENQTLSLNLCKFLAYSAILNSPGHITEEMQALARLLMPKPNEFSAIDGVLNPHSQISFSEKEQMQAIQVVQKLPNTDPMSNYALGLVYEATAKLSDRNKIPNFEKAYKHYLASAHAEFPEAMYRVAELSRMGAIASEGEKTSIYWLERAANFGHNVAQRILGMMYIEGRLVAQDSPKGIKLLEESANTGNPISKTQLAVIYREGKLTKKNDAKALSLLQQASSQGEPSAMRILATLYQNGIGIEKNEEKAYALFEQSAALGDSFAMLSLGLIHQNGLGSRKKNLNLAKEWISKAAQSGNKQAQEILKTYPPLNFNQQFKRPLHHQHNDRP